MNIPTFEQQMESVINTLAEIEVKNRESKRAVELAIVKLENLASIHRIEIQEIQLKAKEASK